MINSEWGESLCIKRDGSGNAVIRFSNSDGELGHIGIGCSAATYAFEPVFTDKNRVDNKIYHSGNFNPSDYLPKSGGNIGDGTKGAPLILTGNQTIVELLLKNSNGTQKGSCAWQDGYGVFLYNYTIGGLLGIKDDGTPVYGNNTLIHSGNIGSQSVSYATNAATASSLLDSTGSEYAYETGGLMFFGRAGFSTYIDGYNIYARSNGSTSFMINPSGNVGIGTTNPAYKLDVNGNIGTSSSINLYSSDQINGYNGIALNYNVSKHVNVSIYDGWTGRIAHFVTGGITFDKSLSVYSSLYVDSTSTFQNKTTHNGGASILGVTLIGQESNNIYNVFNDNCAITTNAHSSFNAIRNALNFQWYNTSWQIGNIRGESTDSAGFGITSSNNNLRFRVTTSQVYCYGGLSVTGNILATGSITMNSMRSMKNIINKNGLSLEELSTIKPTRFTWKDGRDDRIHVGGIADDVMKVLPEVVFKGNDGVLSMDYASAAFVMAASLIKPVSEHERRIANLERENALLKEEIRNLKSA